MKKNLIKKVFAVSLSIAMACSLVPAANTVTASAAAPYVSLKTTFKTLKIGQNYKMTLKNNTSSWKIKKVETTDKTIATVHSKTTSSVMIKGKSEGRATVRVRIKTAKRKANNTKTLRCRVKVIKNVVDPDNPVVVQRDATVATQEELTAALADSNITNITIKTDAATSFTIPDGTYSNVDLTVDAPNADVTNNATFKSITINSIKDETWTENGKNNAISVMAEKARVVVGPNAVVKGITLGKANANIKLVVNGGTVSAVNVNAKVTLNISGTAAATIPVNVAAGAADAEVTSAVPVAIETSVKIKIKLEAGSKGSSVKITVAGVGIDITNNSGDTVPVSLPNGNTQNVLNGQSTTVTAPSTTTPVSNIPNYGGSGNGNPTYKGTTTDEIVTPSAISSAYVLSAKIQVKSGSAMVVTQGAIQVNIDKASPIQTLETKSGGAIQVRVVLVRDSGVNSSIIDWTDCTSVGGGKYITPAKYGTYNLDAGTDVSTIKVRVEYRVAETSAYYAGTPRTEDVTFNVSSETFAEAIADGSKFVAIQ